MKPEDKLAALIAVLLGLVILLSVSCAHAEDRWSIDQTTGLHFGISAGAGFALNAVMIGAEGRNAKHDRIRPWVAFLLCSGVTASKEFFIDSYASYTDLGADLAGCGLGVWSSNKLLITPTGNGVAITGRW